MKVVRGGVFVGLARRAVRGRFRVTRLALLLLLATTGSCAGGGVLGDATRDRPAILDPSAVVRLDAGGDGRQVATFMAAHKAGQTAGLCQGFVSEEMMPSRGSVVTEGGQAALIMDYTEDPLAIDGFRVTPLRHVRGNRFYDPGARQAILLTPWNR